MTKLTKIRYKVSFKIIDTFSSFIYRLREIHLSKLNDKLDYSAGFYWEALERSKYKE